MDGQMLLLSWFVRRAGATDGAVQVRVRHDVALCGDSSNGRGEASYESVTNTVSVHR